MHAESLEKARLNEAVVTFVGVVEIVWVEMKRGWMMGEQRYWSPTEGKRSGSCSLEEA